MNIKIESILNTLNYISFLGNRETVISELIMADESNERDNVLMWLNDKNLFRLKNIEHGSIICSKVNENEINPNCNYIIVENPRGAFKKALETFFVIEEKIFKSDKASVAENVVLGENVSIGDFTVIEQDCIIGNNVKIGHGTVIKARTVIKDNASVGNNCTIGDKGLGYEKDEEGNWQHIPHIGSVLIHEYVSIHDNVVINRAVMGSTEVGAYSKIDSFAMIAHGVKLGRNNMVCGCASIAGSTIIGNDCWIAPNTSIMNKLTIGNNVFVGIGTVVIRNIADNKKVFGNPSKELNI